MMLARLLYWNTFPGNLTYYKAMKKDAILLGLILIGSLFARNNSDNLPIEENYRIGIKVNILNYTDVDFPEGTKIYLGAMVKDTFIAVDSIPVNQKIISPTKDTNPNDLIVTIPESNGDRLNLNLWNINLEKVKKISKKGGILIRFSDKHCEAVCERFEFNENGVYNSFLLMTNVTYDNIGYYSIDAKIEKSNLLLRKDSNLIFKQMINYFF